MKIKVVSLMLVTFLAVGMFAGCSNQQQAPAAQPAPSAAAPAASESAAAPAAENTSKVVVWMAGDDARFMMDSGLPDKFKAETNREAEIVQLPWDALHDKLVAGFAGGDLPSVSQAADHWVGEFAILGGLMEMDAFKDANGHTDDKFLPNSWEHFRFTDGHLYGIPFIWESRVLFYRTDLFEAAGLSGPPTTLDELITFGKALGNGTDRFGMAHQDSWLDFHFFSWILYAYEGDFFDKAATKCTLDEPAAIEAIKYYKSLYDENIIPKAPEKRVEGFKGFKEGYYAMAESGAWWFGLIDTQAPELEGKWDIALLPAGKSTLVYGHPNPWVIPVNAQNPDGVDKSGGEAWLNFMLDTDNSVTYASLYGQLPTTKAAYEVPAIKDNASSMLMYEAILRGTNSVHNVPNAETISEVIWNMLADVRDDVKTPEDAARDTVAIVNGYLS